MNEFKILSKLIEKTTLCTHNGYRIGAVIVDKKGSVLSYGFNSYVKTHPKMLYNPHFSEFQIFVHAEADAIYHLGYKTDPYTLIVCRLSKSNQVMNAKPCIGCYSEIKRSSIKKVYYTNEKGDLVLLNLKTNIEEY